MGNENPWKDSVPTGVDEFERLQRRDKMNFIQAEDLAELMAKHTDPATQMIHVTDYANKRQYEIDLKTYILQEQLKELEKITKDLPK